MQQPIPARKAMTTGLEHIAQVLNGKATAGMKVIGGMLYLQGGDPRLIEPGFYLPIRGNTQSKTQSGGYLPLYATR